MISRWFTDQIGPFFGGTGFPSKKDEEPKKVKAFFGKETEGLSIGF